VNVSEFIARLAQDEGEDKRADAEHHARDPSEPVEVSLNHGRTSEVRGAHSSTEYIGEAAAFARMEKDQGHHSQAEEDMDDYEKCFDN